MTSSHEQHQYEQENGGYDPDWENEPTGSCEECGCDVFDGDDYCAICDFKINACPNCHGVGKDLSRLFDCESCDGTGKVEL